MITSELDVTTCTASATSGAVQSSSAGPKSTRSYVASGGRPVNRWASETGGVVGA